MARTVNVHNIVVEVVSSITKARSELQDEIMDILSKAGHEVLSVESTLLREKRMPDKEGTGNAAGLPAESHATPGESGT